MWFYRKGKSRLSSSCFLLLDNASPFECLRPRKDHLYVAARQDTRDYRQWAGPGWHLHNVTNGETSYLRLDQGRWAGTPAQIGSPSSITKEIAEYMDRMLEDDDELTASEFHRLIVRKFDARIPAPTIRRFLRMKLQWIIVRARTGPMISETNKKRLDFATQCISDKDSFDDIIWTDESSIQLVRHTRSSSLRSFSCTSSSSSPTTPEGPLPPPGIVVSWCRPLPLLQQWCPWHRRECFLHLRDSFPPCTNGPSTWLVPHFSSETWCATKLFSFYTM